MSAPVVILADPGELRPERRLWGTGGWQEPKARTALDWLTLVALLGWDATVCEPAVVADRSLPESTRWIIVACPGDAVTPPVAAALAAHLRRSPALVVACATAPGLPLADLAGTARDPEGLSSRDLVWCGPGARRSWRLRAGLGASSLVLLPGAEVWARLEGAPVIVACRRDRGIVATLGLDASAARDRAGAVTALLKRLLVEGAVGPVAWLDLAGTLVLRMDDPGASQNLHLRSWRYTQLDRRSWARIGGVLARRQARLSVGYVAAWVDDGDPSRGTLELAGRPVARSPGAVHPSAEVRHVTAAGTVNDYAGQYRILRALSARGRVGIELHGYTHLHPARDQWARAADRYEAVRWYREFGEDGAGFLAALPAERHPLALGVAAVRERFGAAPTTVIFPGEAFTGASLLRALNLGLLLVGSYYLALRRAGRFCWVQHVCAPYLDQADAAWLDAELPVVGSFHDRDVALAGTDWLAGHLDRWAAAGVLRLIDYRELAAALGRPLALEAGAAGGLVLRLDDRGAPALVRPLPIRLRSPERRLSTSLTVTTAGGTMTLPVTPTGPWEGLVQLPADGNHGEPARVREGQER
jgi:hypothetical protein